MNIGTFILGMVTVIILETVVMAGWFIIKMKIMGEDKLNRDTESTLLYNPNRIK